MLHQRVHRVFLLSVAFVLTVAVSACAGAGEDGSNVDPARGTPIGPSAPEGEVEESESTETSREGDLVTCLHGTWVADNDYFLLSISEFGDEIQDVSGRVMLSFGDDGSLTTEYQDWLITAIVEGDTVTIRRDGTDVGTFTNTSSTVSMADTHVASTMTLSAESIEMNIEPEPATYTNANYHCDQSTASITTPDGTLKLSRP